MKAKRTVPARWAIFATATAFTLLSSCVALAQDAPDADAAYPGRLELPAVDTEWPGPDEFSIGNAVAPINYWSTAWSVNDMVKLAGFEREIGDPRPSVMWVPVVNFEWRFDLMDELRLDDEGWPLSMELENGDRAEQLATILMGGAEIPGAYPAGDYTLTWNGGGEMSFDGVTVINETPGEMTLRYDGNATVFLFIQSLDQQNPLREISMLRPDAVAGERFPRAYLDYLRPYSVVRPLHFTGDQLTYGTEISWEERKPADYSHWGGALGAPYEVAIDMANQSASDLWLNVPIAADDRFVTELAKLTRDQLNSQRRLYFELGNELWNWSWPYALGREYALEAAEKRWPGVLGTVRPYSDGEPVHENMMIYSWQGARTAEIARIFRDVWGNDADRVVVVLSGQIGGSHPSWAPSRDLLSCPVSTGEDGGRPCAEAADAFAVAPYVSEAEGEIEFDRSSPEAFIGEAIEWIRGEGEWGRNATEPGLRYAIRNDAALAAQYGLALVAYEGGQHFIGSRFTRDVISNHPGMRDLYNALFEVWQEEGGGLFVHFAGIIPRGRNEPGEEPTYFQSENFGIKELQTQTRAEAPKWDAVLDTMVEIGQIERR